ncbi:DoxX family protein [Candidatus Woesearchaeota archaeon]|nr:DoxX family protein [Candidatus Woesearchaeota archaeon]
MAKKKKTTEKLLQATVQKLNYAPLLVRLGIGVMFLLFGWMKTTSLLQDGSQSFVIGLLSGLGFSPVMLWAWLLALTELVGGLLVLLGLLTRWASLPLTIVLIVAISTVTWKDPMNLLKDLGLLGATASLLLSGSGPWSLDNLQSKK